MRLEAKGPVAGRLLRETTAGTKDSAVRKDKRMQ